MNIDDFEENYNIKKEGNNEEDEMRRESERCGAPTKEPKPSSLRGGRCCCGWEGGGAWVSK